MSEFKAGEKVIIYNKKGKPLEKGTVIEYSKGDNRTLYGIEVPNGRLYSEEELDDFYIQRAEETEGIMDSVVGAMIDAFRTELDKPCDRLFECNECNRDAKSFCHLFVRYNYDEVAQMLGAKLRELFTDLGC